MYPWVPLFQICKYATNKIHIKTEKANCKTNWLYVRKTTKMHKKTQHKPKPEGPSKRVGTADRCEFTTAMNSSQQKSLLAKKVSKKQNKLV